MTEVSRKLLAISDDTPECVSAMVFAGLRAKVGGAGLVLLRCARVPGWGGWAGLDREIAKEAEDGAKVKLSQHADLVEERTGVIPEQVVILDEPVDAIRKAIDADLGIQVLILASGAGRFGPGPLVSRLGRGRALAGRPIAVTVIPGELSDDQLAQLGGVAI